jgi:hypothetical protein
MSMPKLLSSRKRISLLRTLFLLIFLAPCAAFAQYWQVGGMLGTSNYSGDLSQQRVDMRYTRYNLGLFVKRDINRYVTLRFGLSYGRVAAADSTNKSIDLQRRNLSFRSPIIEAHIAAEFNFLDIDEKGFTPYVFAGVGVFSFFPTTRDSLGNVIKLRHLNTEGEDIPMYGRKQYDLRSISIPFGAGIKVLLRDNLVAGFEIGIRKTFTDYLDDVSKTYVDRNTLLAYYGPQSVKYAYRGDEASSHVGQLGYPTDGTMRGNPKNKDWYIFSGVTLAYRFGGGSGGPWGHWKKQKFSQCPRL